MQLNKKCKVGAALLAATSTVLGHSANAADGDWDFESALLLYTESDGRVSAIEPAFSATRDMGDQSTLTFKAVTDVLTGATPSGAVASSAAQCLTQPSGRACYTVAPGETPLDPSFRDTRVSFTTSYHRPFADLWSADISGFVSAEYDYQSIGFSTVISRDFDRRNTTLFGGLSLEFDTLDPEGGVPIPFATLPNVAASLPRSGDSETKTVTDLIFGVTQVLGHDTIGQLNLNYSISDGYLTDPFKVISILDVAPLTAGEPLRNIYEHRPDERAKYGLFSRIKHQFDGGQTLDFSYRFQADDWGFDSHTLEARYRMPIGGGWLTPHVRYYTQGRTDFWVHSLLDGDPLPQYASADYRLGDLDTITVGLEYGRPLADGDLRIRAEIYQQMYDPGALYGVQSSFEQLPDMTAIILQASYSFGAD